METHVKFLGLLNILVGGFGGLAASVFFLLFAGATTVSTYGPLIAFVVTGWMWLMLVLTIPAIVLGIGLLNFRPWTRSIGTVIAILEILNFPLGTVTGLYGLWVLMSPEADPLFSRRFR